MKIFRLDWGVARIFHVCWTLKGTMRSFLNIRGEKEVYIFVIMNFWTKEKMTGNLMKRLRGILVKLQMFSIFLQLVH